MRVEVVRMRLRGAKIAMEAVKGAPPHEGWLHIRTEAWRPHWLPDRRPAPTAIATLTEEPDAETRQVLPQLLHVVMRHWEGHQWLLVGREILLERGHPAEFDQTWWCRAQWPKRRDEASHWPGPPPRSESPAPPPPVVDEVGDWLKTYAGEEEDA